MFRPCPCPFLRAVALLFVAAAARLTGAAAAMIAPAPHPNVLFIAIDDLPNALGCLGAAHALTPRLDAFAATARVFTKHYVQVPTCGASRCALMTGRYPARPVHINNNAMLATHADYGPRTLPAWM
ncbi:MAG: sulfatase-like hydrolase/transferase, partial [Opitutaceae bacterium]|nr:sulfatase-like hydrolase/transferase [Opitutaceae bacterium]